MEQKHKVPDDSSATNPPKMTFSPHDLTNIPFFGHFSEREIAQISRTGTFHECAPNEYLLHEKDNSRDFFVLISGRMVVTRTLYAGDEKELSFIEPGEFFGEMAFLDGSPRSASVRCVEKGVFFKISRESFEHLVTRKPTIAYKMTDAIAAALTQRLRKSNDLVESFFSNPNKAIIEFKRRLLKIQTMLQRM